MSKSASSRQRQKKNEQEVLTRLHEDFEPWTKSRQARYHADEKSWSRLDGVHNDGEKIYQCFTDNDGKSLKPFHRS